LVAAVHLPSNLPTHIRDFEYDLSDKLKLTVKIITRVVKFFYQNGKFFVAISRYLLGILRNNKHGSKVAIIDEIDQLHFLLLD
jgi:hypothetical protein